MMRTSIVLLALVSLVYSAPQPRKTFHEHNDDFFNVVMEESGQEIINLWKKYSEYEEFLAGLEYLISKDLKALVDEMEGLPEFKVVVIYLEGHGIDITYFIDALDEFLDSIDKRRSRQQVSGRDITAFIKDAMTLFPMDKLADLYMQKIEEDSNFASAMRDLGSAEWKEILQALLDNETFKKEVQTLKEHGFDINIFFDVPAVFRKL